VAEARTEGQDLSREMALSWNGEPRRLPGLFGEVHIWRASVSEVRSGETALSEPERERAAAFRSERDRRRFTACRTILRSVLGRYLSAEPQSLEFDEACLFCGRQHGKPRLAGLRFSASRSHGLAVVAVARDFEVGVDVEQDDPAIRFTQIAPHVLTHAELALSWSRWSVLRAWTLKEAYLKATGEGLSVDPIHVELDVISRSWWLGCFVPSEGYAGAVACEAQSPTVRGFTWGR
jgi:4'-phosphopantetheinyl transferase